MRNRDQRNYRISIALQIIGIAVLMVCCAYLIAGLLMFNSTLFAGSMWTARITGGQALVAMVIAAAALLVTVLSHRNAERLSGMKKAEK